MTTNITAYSAQMFRVPGRHERREDHQCTRAHQVGHDQNRPRSHRSTSVPCKQPEQQPRQEPGHHQPGHQSGSLVSMAATIGSAISMTPSARLLDRLPIQNR